MFSLTMMTRKRRMKKQQALFGHKSIARHIGLHLPRQIDFSKFAATSITLAILCTCVPLSESASVTPTSSNSNNNIRNSNPYQRLLRNFHTREVRGVGSPPLRGNTNNYHFLEQQNEYDSSSSGVSILDDDTLKLSLAIDDDTASGGLSAPSLHILEPKVYLRVSGESGMMKPDYQQQKVNSNNKNDNEVIIRESASRFPSFRASSSPKQEGEQGADLHYHQSNEEDHEPVGGEEDEEDEDDMSSDNYHHHFPYIESYREKYVKPDFGHYVPSVVTTTPPPPLPPTTTQPTPISSEKAAQASSSSASQTKQHEWSDIIAQVTTPSSLNEINPSASEHRLADFHIRANLPAYYYNKYSSYSEEDLENVADLDDEHSKYFVKTRPRSVTTAGSNLYSNFYYEPPSFSTKSVPIPVKTNKEKVVFASIKPTEDSQHLYPTSRANEETHDQFSGNDHNNGGQIYHDEEAQRDSPVMTAISSNFSSHISTMTPQQMNYDGEADKAAAIHSDNDNDNYSNESFLKPSASSTATHNRNQAQQQQQKQFDNYYKSQKNQSKNNNKSSAETLDVSTSQSILSKVTVNNPHHPQLVIIKAEPIKTTLATPGHEILTSSFAPTDDGNSNNNDEFRSDGEDLNANNAPEMSTPSTITTTTDATSIPGIPGIDYPTLGEIPQTGFDCQKQRYKGFFADIDAKCQAWHYCDFHENHSSFLCPNGTLFSQVLLTCDWWFNVDCNQARQLYVLNERLYRYIKPPKPSFPEDFIGEHVDKWLLQQFTDGYLPKVRRKGKAKLVHLPPRQPHPTSTDSPVQRNETDSEA